jgi:hypothetical protein
MHWQNSILFCGREGVWAGQGQCVGLQAQISGPTRSPLP